MTDGPLLVTGGTGLLGHALRPLCPDAIFVSSREYDLRERREVVTLFQDVRPSQVIHLAARVGGVKANAERNVELLESNAAINAAVLSVARECRVRRLIAVLSSCAFPLYDDRPSTEADLHAELPYQANLGYAFAKRLLDVHVGLVARDKGLWWSTIAPVTMYGPHDHFDPDAGHVIGALFHRCWHAKQTGEALTVWGSGEAVRQFVFVNDVARLLVLMLGHKLGPETVIIAPDAGMTIRSLAEAVARAMQYEGPIHYDTNQPEGVRVKRLHSERFQKAFSTFAFTTLEDGLKETARWYLSTKCKADMPCLAAQTSAEA
ncbi:MAG: NAD-dependent epimerase/dehydratase family protein [Nitrospirota bacterium]|nr:NAD-dependent epimerase/dehydratase family protein [Nitrospirota bacterium]